MKLERSTLGKGVSYCAIDLWFSVAVKPLNIVLLLALPTTLRDHGGVNFLCFDSCAADHFPLLAQPETFQQRLLVCLVCLVLQSVMRLAERSTQNLNFLVIAACTSEGARAP